MSRRFLVAVGGCYALLIAALTLTISPYFALGWDVTTFIAAGRSLLDGPHGPFALYQQSRADFYWPYAYPPLHALLVAPFLLLSRLLPILSESLLARLPVVLFDLGLAWFLYAEIWRTTQRRDLARLAAIVWLFNPVTLYHTAVQAHFESEWLLLILLAYAGAISWQRADGRAAARSLIVSGLLLAAAILVKQVAVIYAVPYWLYLWREGRRREMFGSGVLAALAIGVVCLPFALYSDDFLFMVTSYVAQMPVQTQSWLVWLLLLQDQLTTSHTSNFFLLRYSTPILAVLATLVSAWQIGRAAFHVPSSKFQVDDPTTGNMTQGARNLEHGTWNIVPALLYRVGLLVTLVFFLFSSKVMGYYYAILVPFLILVLLPQGRLKQLAVCLGMLSWILLSPYYASWAKPEHLWLYAGLGTVNSAFFVWAAFQVSRFTSHAGAPDTGNVKPGRAAFQVSRFTFHVGASETGNVEPGTWNMKPGTLAAVVGALGLALAMPILFQPLHAIPWVAGRQDLSELLAGGVLLMVTLLLVIPLVRLVARLVGEAQGRWAFLAAALYFPLTFMQFYVMRESTRIVELLW